MLKETPTETAASQSCCASKTCLLSGNTLAFLVLRGWLGVRAVVAGIEKFSTSVKVQKPLIDPVTSMEDPSGAMVDVAQKIYGWSHYKPVAQTLQDKFANEPLLPGFLTAPFYTALGPALILLGLMLLAGIGTRISLFLQGLLYTMLSVGLMLIEQDQGVAWLGIHIALVALALTLVDHNRLALLKKW